MIYELVYTSVPRGLKPGSKGYCTVLTTESIPSSLQERLESLCGYRHLFDPGSTRNPVNYMHHKIQIAGNTWHILSRIADAGSDYSQRSNLIAHHIAISQDEIKDLTCGPTTLMLHPGFFRTTWNEEPRRAKEPETRSRLARLSGSARVASEWKKLTGDAGFAGELAKASEESGSQPLHLVYPLGGDILQIIDEAMVLLPKISQWQVTFNSFFTKSIEDCKWRFYCDAAPESKAFAGSKFDLVQISRSGLVPDQSNTLVNLARTGKLIAQDANRGRPEVAASLNASTFVKKEQVKRQEPDDGFDLELLAKKELRAQGKYQDPAFKRTTPPVIQSELPPVLPKSTSGSKKVREPEGRNPRLLILLGTAVLSLGIFVTGMIWWSKNNSNPVTDKNEAENSNSSALAHTEPPIEDPKVNSPVKNRPLPNTKDDRNSVEEGKPKVLIAQVETPKRETKPDKQDELKNTATKPPEPAAKKTPGNDSPVIAANQNSTPKAVIIENEIKLNKISDELFVVNLAKEFKKGVENVRINLSENKIQIPDDIKPVFLDKKLDGMEIKKEKHSDGQTDILMIKVPALKDQTTKESNISSPTNFCVSGTIDKKPVTIAMYEPIRIELQKGLDNQGSLAKYQLVGLSEKNKRILDKIKLFSTNTDKNQEFDFEITQFTTLDSKNIFFTETSSFNDFPKAVQDRLKIISRSDNNSNYLVDENMLSTQAFYDKVKTPLALFCIGLTREKTKEVNSDLVVYDRFLYEGFLFAPALNINPNHMDSFVYTKRLISFFRASQNINNANPEFSDAVKKAIDFYKKKIEDLKSATENGNLNEHQPILLKIKELNPNLEIKIDQIRVIKSDTSTDVAKSTGDNKLKKEEAKKDGQQKSDADLNKEFLKTPDGKKIIDILQTYYLYRLEELQKNLDLITNQKQGFVINVIGKNNNIRLPIAIYRPDQVSSDESSKTRSN